MHCLEVPVPAEERFRTQEELLPPNTPFSGIRPEAGINQKVGISSPTDHPISQLEDISNSKRRELDTRLVFDSVL